MGGERIVERGAITYERNLQDDYVKFIRLADISLSTSGSGVAGLITNHAYLGNITLRGMRSHLLKTFDVLAILDLHGNSKIKEVPPPGVRDENVFDIQQGVAVAILTRGRGATEQFRTYAELWGTRKEKYLALMQDDAVPALHIRPVAPGFLFVPQDEALVTEYSQWTLLFRDLPTLRLGDHDGERWCCS